MKSSIIAADIPTHEIRTRMFLNRSLMYESPLLVLLEEPQVSGALVSYKIVVSHPLNNPVSHTGLLDQPIDPRVFPCYDLGTKSNEDPLMVARTVTSPSNILQWLTPTTALV